MKTIGITFKSILVLALMLASSGCIQDKFDQPPVDGQDPDMTATHTIADLKQMYTGTTYAITDSVIISGIINADDRTGNFYKVITLQDETAGLAIRVDGNSLFSIYPVGRRIFIKMKGLYIGEYNGMIQIGGAPTAGTINEVEAIPNAILENFIVKGSLNNPLTPLNLTIDQLNNSHQNMLIRLDSVEIASSDTSKTYANYVTQTSSNINVKDCNSNTAVLRNSGFADFAAEPLPNGRGSLTAIYSVFGSTKQLLIRDTDDLILNGPRCGSAPIPGVLISIRELRNMYTGANTPIPSGRKIKGVVISDFMSGNLVGPNMIVQDASAGITFRFGSNYNHSFSMNTEVEISLDGAEITTFSGLMQVQYIDPVDVSVIGTANITPRQATIQQVSDSSLSWESTLVEISAATITNTQNPGVYNGNANANDGTASMVLYTRSAANFSGTALPAGPVNFKAIVSRFNATKQLQLRNINDVQ